MEYIRANTSDVHFPGCLSHQRSRAFVPTTKLFGKLDGELSLLVTARCSLQDEICHENRSRHEKLHGTHSPNSRCSTQTRFHCTSSLREHRPGELGSLLFCVSSHLSGTRAFSSWGARRSPGCLPFREKNLLYTPGLSSIFSKFQITQVMAHEISHMWFGNMVTPKWWNQIWLSEGFSNFFEIVAADHVSYKLHKKCGP